MQQNVQYEYEYEKAHPLSLSLSLYVPSSHSIQCALARRSFEILVYTACVSANEAIGQ